MNLASFGLIISGVLLNAIAQLALKASVRQMGEIKLSLNGAWPVTLQLMGEPALWLGLFCYGISVIIWILALSRVDVTIAYPMLSIGYIVNAVLAWYLFGEALTPERLLGIGIIIVGVYILARS
ncbi:MAG: EamA family transporter [Proteobacteria bacterium]|jgi:multidrug transporter EmrE-like cation transporter|nr:EamA family transporter [Pseudomonadota bacterium]MCG6935532.1 EamA family transporter [Pseudomonadota bacterium]